MVLALMVPIQNGSPVARLLHRLPDNIPFEVGAAIEPTAICVTSILERSQLQAGETVLITGPGPIGLISLAIAKMAGVRMVGITGRSSAEGVRFQKARELGTDFIINVDKEDPVQKILTLTDGLGVDILIETSGGEKAISQAFEMVRRLGRVCAIGISGNRKFRFLMIEGSLKPSVSTFASPAVGPPGRRR
jgi:L-iditol 2-dehydrogenase